MSADATAMASRASRSWPLLTTMVRRELRVRYRQALLEMAWSLVTPVVVLAVYGVVLTQFFGVGGDGVPYLSMVWIGMVAWTMFSTAVGSGVHSIVGNADLVSKVYFPREVLPLSVVGASLFDLCIGVAVLVPLLAVQVRAVSMTAFAVVPVGLVLLVWTAAVTVLVAVVAVFVRDLVHATRLLLQVGFFATPVMYSQRDLPSSFQTLHDANPLAVCIDAWRDALLHQQWPDWRLLGLHGLAGVLLFAGSIAYTRRVEDRMVDVI